MARQFRSDDSSAWLDKYGSGSDGAGSINTSTDAPIDSAATGTSGATSLSATNGSFAAGQLVLIIQTVGTGAGNWELNKISSYVAGTITLAYALQNTYAAGAQVIVIKQYSSYVVNSGQTLTAKAWNGTVGGVVVVMCNGTITITGNITGAAKGHSGGGQTAATDQSGTQGSSYNGAGGVTTAANNGGGGGGIRHLAGQYNPSSGGGGGYGAAGSTAVQNGNAGTMGVGGGTYGVAGLTSLHLGSGGGSGGSKSGFGGRGGIGGGIVFLIGKTITITGAINANGEAGQPGSGSGDGDGGAGGGGSGGSILLKGGSLTLGSSLLASTGGAGNTLPVYSDSGPGGAGRIHADYATSISGTTNPTIDSRQDSILMFSLVKKVLGLDRSSVKSVNGLAIASVKSVNALA